MKAIASTARSRTLSSERAHQHAELVVDSRGLDASIRQEPQAPDLVRAWLGFGSTCRSSSSTCAVVFARLSAASWTSHAAARTRRSSPLVATSTQRVERGRLLDLTEPAFDARPDLVGRAHVMGNGVLQEPLRLLLWRHRSHHLGFHLRQPGGRAFDLVSGNLDLVPDDLAGCALRREVCRWHRRSEGKGEKNGPESQAACGHAGQGRKPDATNESLIPNP